MIESSPGKHGSPKGVRACLVAHCPGGAEWLTQEMRRGTLNLRYHHLPSSTWHIEFSKSETWARTMRSLH